MTPEVEEVIRDWQEQFHQLQMSAAKLMTAAFPALSITKPPTGCCDLRLYWQDEETKATGYVCVDDFMQASLEFEGLRQDVGGRALDDIFGPAWFEGDGAANGIAEAVPGTYWWADENNAAEWEVKVKDGGIVDINIQFTNAPDIAAFLDALRTAGNAVAAETTAAATDA